MTQAKNTIMTTNNHKTTFWELLNNYSIEIPIIQRDYAQGREGKESLRKNFLSDLKNALDNRKEMKLDFVYGSTENGKLYPLDGQQRLTTLWLLHWYIALKAGKLKDASARLVKFSYETRVSSREFCKALCDPDNFDNYHYDQDVIDFITNQTWFYSAWKQDPTIQSMLRMLGGSKDNINKDDGIEVLFGCDNQNCVLCSVLYNECIFEYYFDLLTEQGCPIVFYYLPKDFGNSDDLYIKMNARGEQLTSFESFKADLIGYMTKQSENEKLDVKEREAWKKLLDPKDGIPIKLDTKWTNIFWEKRSLGLKDKAGRRIKTNQIDEIYFAFLNRLFWNYLFLSKDKNENYVLRLGEGILPNGEKTYTIENENASYKYLNEENYNAYYNIDPYKYDGKEIPLGFFKNLSLILDRYADYKKEIPKCKWDSTFRFIPEYKKDEQGYNFQDENEKILTITALTQVQRIVFFAICKYFQEGKADDISLSRWMRVVWNLVSGTGVDGRDLIRSTSAMRTAIEFISSLDSHNVYLSLVSKLDNNHYFDLSFNGIGKDFGNTDFEKRCKEEIAKARQIIIDNPRNDGKQWGKVIFEAENTAFFRGSIRFLFTTDKGNIDWRDFDEKWENAKKCFDKPEKDYPKTIELAKYFSDDDVRKLWKQYDFTIESKVWKALLLLDYPKQIHDFLIMKPVKESELIIDINNLISIIKSDLRLRDWQTDNLFLTNYRSQVSEPDNGYVYMVGNRWRNKLINNLKNAENFFLVYQKCWGEDYVEQEGIRYFKGLRVDFRYNVDNYFRLWENNTICLMTKDWAGKKLKDENKEANPENTYCFNAKDENVDSIANQLDNLIIQSTQ